MQSAPPDTVYCFFCGVPGLAGGVCSECVVPLPFVACGACGRKGSPSSSACRCGAPLGTTERGDVTCPRCRVPLAATSAGVAIVHPCPTCHGMFVSARAWCALLSVPERAPELATAVDRGGALPVQAVVGLVTCPVCARQMERGRFAAGSEVVIDVCDRHHGIWLDAGELVGLVAFVGRRREIGATDARRETEQRASERDVARELAALRSAPPSAARVVVVERKRGLGLPILVAVATLVVLSLGGALALQRTLPSKMVDEAPKKAAEAVE